MEGATEAPPAAPSVPALRKLPRVVVREASPGAAEPRVGYVPADPASWRLRLAPGAPLPPPKPRPPPKQPAEPARRPDAPRSDAVTPPSPPLTHDAEPAEPPPKAAAAQRLPDAEKRKKQDAKPADGSRHADGPKPPKKDRPKDGAGSAAPKDGSAPPKPAKQAGGDAKGDAKPKQDQKPAKPRGDKDAKPGKGAGDADRPAKPAAAPEKRPRADPPASSGKSGSDSLPAPKKPRLEEERRSVSPRPPTEQQLEAQKAVMARIAAKMDLDKGFDSDAHSETSTSPRRRAPAAAAEQALPRKRDCRYLSQKSMAPGTDAADVVKDELDKYVAFGDSEGGKRTAETAEVVELEFPGEGASERYPLIEPKKAGELAPVGDIYNSAKLIVQYVVPAAHRGDLGDINSGILRSIIKACHTKNHEALKAAIEEWNAKMRKMKEDNVFALLELQAPAAPQPLINHILEQAYSRTVAPYSELLNQYRAFGNNVYGEVKSGLVREFIKNARIQPHHVFIDMGSGIGNVVLQIAGEVLAESHGVEVMDIPAKLGGRQLKEFLSRMRYYAQPCGKVRLRHANFLTDPETDEVLKRADVVFVNNYAFEPRLNQLCLAKFLDLKEGARVISLRSFVHQDRRINYRTADALESIFRVKEFHFGTDMVSWTNEGGRYFVHTVDRSMLRSYAKEAGVGL